MLMPYAGEMQIPNEASSPKLNVMWSTITGGRPFLLFESEPCDGDGPFLVREGSWMIGVDEFAAAASTFAAFPITNCTRAYLVQRPVSKGRPSWSLLEVNEIGLSTEPLPAPFASLVVTRVDGKKISCSPYGTAVSDLGKYTCLHRMGTEAEPSTAATAEAQS